MRKQTFLAAAISPLVSVPIFVVWFAVFYWFLRSPDDAVDSWLWLLVFLGYVLPIACITTFVVGVPVGWLLRRLEMQSHVTYAVVGFVLGGAVGVKLFPPSHLAAVVALSGLAISVVFGLISNPRDEATF